MNDLNILHAQNADLKNRVADSGLACDSPASAPDCKDVDAFRLAMGEGMQEFDGSPMRNAYLSQRQDVLTDAPMRNGAYPHEEVHPYKGALPREGEQAEANASMQAQFSSFFSLATMFSEADAPAQVEAARHILTQEELEILVDRILVSAAKDGMQEVRLTLSQSILAGTEIVLSRAVDGQLTVVLHCTDASAFQTLVASQADLQKMLEAHEAEGVNVSVNIHQESNDAGRRSRGYFEFDPAEPGKTDNA